MSEPGAPPDPAPRSTFNRLLSSYLSAYRGLSPQTWRLTVGCFIQRAGTMVLPFLTIYLSKEAKMTESQSASILFYHGLGAVLGSLLAARTLGRWSARSNMLASLFASGASLLLLYWAQGYAALAICAGLSSLVEAPFRPAAMTEISRCEPEHNQPRAVALLRLGINAGMMLGPAVGGALALYDYAYLFYVDALTCVLAGLWFLRLASPPKHPREQSSNPDAPPAEVETAPIYRDGPFLLMLAAQLAQFLVIFQLVSTVPLFLSQQRAFLEPQIGIYFLINGLMIVLFEMALVQWSQRWSAPVVFAVGSATMALGIASVALAQAPWAIYLTVVVWTFGEMVSMPILNALVIRRAKTRPGAYLALFSAATNTAMLFAAPAGLWIVHHWGYTELWGSVAGLGLVCALLGLAIHAKISPSERRVLK